MKDSLGVQQTDAAENKTGTADAKPRSWREMDAGRSSTVAREQHRQSQWAERQADFRHGMLSKKAKVLMQQ